MKNEGKKYVSIKNVAKLLKFLGKHTDLHDPNQVKWFIAQHKVSNGAKRNLTIAYERFARYYEIEWEKPKYIDEAKPIRIPTKERLGKLIAGAGRTLSLKLQISMETGLRPIELMSLKIKDVDTQQRIIYPTTAKYGASRQLRISENLAERISDYIHRTHRQPEQQLFKGSSAKYGKLYRKARNRLAKRDPSLKNIRLYDFRHYFATSLYNKTKDILLVKQQMGHKRLDTTLIYTQLLNLNEDEWTCRTASTVDEARQLIEAGYQYVTDMDGYKLFRKRK